jgi:hypothetical protein
MIAWFKEMFSLLRQYRQAGKDYKAAMRALEARVKDMGRRGYND